MQTSIKWYKRTIKDYPVEIPEGLSYRKLSELTGIHYSYFSLIFSGKRPVSEKVAERIVKALKEIKD